MANKKRPSLTDLTTGKSALSRHVVQKGDAVYDAPAAKAAKTAGGSGLRYMQTRLSNGGWQALKLLSVKQERPLQGLVIEALNDLLRKYGEAPVVTGPEGDGKDDK